MSWKRLLLIFALVTCFGSIAGCGGDEDEDEDEDYGSGSSSDGGSSYVAPVKKDTIYS